MKHLRYSLLLLQSIAFSNTSQAQSDPVWVNGINYEFNEETKTASVTYGGDYVGDIVIPSSVKGYAENGGYPPTQNGDIRSLFMLFTLMAMQY